MWQRYVLVAVVAMIPAFAVGQIAGRESMRREFTKRIESAFSGFPTEGTAAPSTIPEAPLREARVFNQAGEAYELRSVRFTIEGFSEHDVLTAKYQDPAHAKDGARFLVVTMTVTNTASEEFYFRPDGEKYFRLADAQGRKYQQSNDHWQATSDYLGARTLGPGVPESGTLIYEVPLDASGFYLEEMVQ